MRLLRFASQMKNAEELDELSRTGHTFTEEDMVGWKKIEEKGGSYVTATFWNPTLKETFYNMVQDYDYYGFDIKNQNVEYLYNMPIDYEALRDYKKFKGIIQEGDKVRVVKGRTLPKGFEGIVKTIYPIYDKYHRKMADYIRFESGEKINLNNVELIKE